MDADRYYLDGLIKIPKFIVDFLKGMNANVVTSSKESDYRFLSALLSSVFTNEELADGCVKMASRESNKENQLSSTSKYQPLDPRKFEFVKGRMKIFNSFLYFEK